MNTNQKMALAGTPRHLELTAPLGKAKRDYLLINVSGSCNYNCKKCCNLVPNKRVVLSLKEIKKLIAESKSKLGVRAVAFMGEGETALAPNFRKIISYANKTGLYSIIFTNGYFVDKKLAVFLSKNNASVVFSVDSLQKRKYEELTGTKNAFNKVMENIKACRKVFAKKTRIEHGKKIVRLGINMLLMEGTIGEANQLKKFCGEEILPVFNYPLMSGNALDHANLFGKPPGSILKLAAPTNLPEKKKECGYFFNGITIGLDGSLLACPYSLELTGKVANIKDASLEEAAIKHDNIIKKFKKLDGKSYCVMRSTKYGKLLKALEGQNERQ